MLVLVAGGVWQNGVRPLVAEPAEPTLVLAVVVIAPLFALLLLTARAGSAADGVGGPAARPVVPRWVARIVGVVARRLVLYWLAAGVLFNG